MGFHDDLGDYPYDLFLDIKGEDLTDTQKEKLADDYLSDLFRRCGMEPTCNIKRNKSHTELIVRDFHAIVQMKWWLSTKKKSGKVGIKGVPEHCYKLLEQCMWDSHDWNRTSRGGSSIRAEDSRISGESEMGGGGVPGAGDIDHYENFQPPQGQ